MRRAARFAQACVASPHHLASEAGRSVLQAGGNAVDAAVAANLVLGVVTPYYCGFGGDVFAMVWDGERTLGYLGSGPAPAAAVADDVRRAAASDEMPLFGPLTVTVPGAVAGWFDLLDRFGTRSFEQLAAPAAHLAREGFPISARAAGYIARASTLYAGEQGWRRLFGGVRAGDVLRNPELALTIETLGRDGRDAYYRGEIAEVIVEHLRSRGGLLAMQDLDAHRGGWVEPMSARYRDVTVLELPPPTQGVAALEMLLVAQLQPRRDPLERLHLLIETAKMCLADRNRYVTDPAWMTMRPQQLLEDDWVDERAALVSEGSASKLPPGGGVPGGTAAICAADRDGMMVSLIQSNWIGFGSGVVVPGWGFGLHNRGSFFSLDAAHPNVIAPGKRTLHTLVPALAIRDGRPWMVFGSMGGDGQAQTHLQLLVRMIDDGLDPQEAIDAPRWLVRPQDWSVIVEARYGAEVLEQLAARGQRVVTAPGYDSVMGHAHAIQVTGEGYACATDPRAEGAALGF